MSSSSDEEEPGEERDAAANDHFEGDPQSYAVFRKAVKDAGLELKDGRQA